MITYNRGNYHIEYFPKKVSTAMALNDLVYVDTNGYLIPAVDGVALFAKGLLQKKVLATDSDYATATRVPVLVPDKDTVFLCDCTTTTPAQTDVGEFVDIDDAKNVDVGASTYDIFEVVGIVSSTQVLAKLAVKGGAAAG